MGISDKNRIAYQTAFNNVEKFIGKLNMEYGFRTLTPLDDLKTTLEVSLWTLDAFNNIHKKTLEEYNAKSQDLNKNRNDLLGRFQNAYRPLKQYLKTKEDLRSKIEIIKPNN